MVSNKHFSDLKADTALAEAARHVLSARLAVVRDHLPLALYEADRDAEHVHQLRVGTRRARAALDIFALFLTPKTYKAAKRRLRGIRRAAGEARDWDVFLAHLDAWASKHPGKHRPGLDFLHGVGVAQRMTAQNHLKMAHEEAKGSFDAFVAEILDAVHKPRHTDPRTLGEHGRPLVAALLDELHQAANDNLDDYAHLHRVRIVGKRLRYAMEVFANCFDPAFRDQFYPAVEEMQEILGNANDSHVACGRLQALSGKLQATLPADWKRYKIGIEALLHFHERRLPQERRRFRQWWNRWQDAGDEAALREMMRPTMGRP